MERGNRVRKGETQTLRELLADILEMNQIKARSHSRVEAEGWKKSGSKLPHSQNTRPVSYAEIKPQQGATRIAMRRRDSH